MGGLPGIIHSWYIIANTGSDLRGSRDRLGLYAVNDIKAHGKDEDGTRMYLVSWKGYGPDQDTWEYPGQIDRGIVRAYRKRALEQMVREDTISGRSISRRRRSTLLGSESGVRGRRRSMPSLG